MIIVIYTERSVGNQVETVTDGLIVAPDCEPCQIDHGCEAEPDECWHEPKWWTCAYYQTVDKPGVQTQPCSFGCYDEPNCVTGQPTEGWPS